VEIRLLQTETDIYPERVPFQPGWMPDAEEELAKPKERDGEMGHCDSELIRLIINHCKLFHGQEYRAVLACVHKTSDLTSMALISSIQGRKGYEPLSSLYLQRLTELTYANHGLVPGSISQLARCIIELQKYDAAEALPYEAAGTVFDVLGELPITAIMQES
jgi:hypothetical protein